MEDLEKIKGFVALIDVLGFRELVGRDDDLSEVRDYIKTVVSVLDNSTGPSQLQFVLFSDNLVINTRNDTADSFKSITLACSHLSFQLAKQRIAVRGAIAHGSFMRSPTTRQGVILAGRPIVEANQYQHYQNWVGIILAPSVVRRDDNLKHSCNIIPPKPTETMAQWAERLSLAIHLQHWPLIPFHASTSFESVSYDGYAIVPMDPGINMPETISKSLSDLTYQLNTMKMAAPDPASQEKYASTLKWLADLSRRWAQCALGHGQYGIGK